MMDLRQAATALEAQLLGDNVDFSSVSIDTRCLQVGDLYVAIKGERFDGHEFITQAEQAGAVALVVETRQQSVLPQLLVTDTRLALGQLASAWRQNVDTKILAVTGSNGKTTVKEICTTILQQQAVVLSTCGNLNNDIGVPLTLLKLASDHRYAVIEMGANHLGEIAYSSGLVSPDVGVITNAGNAHLEGFGSREAVAQGKGEIINTLKAQGTAVLCADDAYLDEWKDRAKRCSVITFGLSAGADVQAINIQPGSSNRGFYTDFSVLYADQSEEVRLPLAGQHNVLNALAATAACLALGVSLVDIALGLAKVKPVPGRMQLLTGVKGGQVVHDAYNANPSSFLAALEALSGQEKELWVALGAFGELGQTSPELHAELGKNARKQGVTRLFATDADCQFAVDAFGEGGFYFEQQAHLIEAVQKQFNSDIILLVKGSRSQKMEHLVAALCDYEEPDCVITTI